MWGSHQKYISSLIFPYNEHVEFLLRVLAYIWILTLKKSNTELSTNKCSGSEGCAFNEAEHLLCSAHLIVLAIAVTKLASNKTPTVLPTNSQFHWLQRRGFDIPGWKEEKVWMQRVTEAKGLQLPTKHKRDPTYEYKYIFIFSLTLAYSKCKDWHPLLLLTKGVKNHANVL